MDCKWCASLKLAAAAVMTTALAGLPVELSMATEADVSGTWELTVETQQGTATPTITLAQDGEKITGIYSGRMGRANLEGTLKGDDIEFSVTLRFQDMPFTITYSGRVNGDVMRGTARFGESGSGAWSARRREDLLDDSFFPFLR